MRGGIAHVDKRGGQSEDLTDRWRRWRRCCLGLEVAEWRLAQEQADAELRAECVEQVEHQKGHHGEQRGALAAYPDGDLATGERDDDLAFRQD